MIMDCLTVGSAKKFASQEIILIPETPPVNRAPTLNRESGWTLRGLPMMVSHGHDGRELRLRSRSNTDVEPPKSMDRTRDSAVPGNPLALGSLSGFKIFGPDEARA